MCMRKELTQELPVYEEGAHTRTARVRGRSSHENCPCMRKELTRELPVYEEGPYTRTARV